ncbi:MAG: two-component regulator propeller domain-containing protein [Bacteroidia bacterium]
MIRYNLTILLFIIINTINAQQTKIDQWEEYLPYDKGQSVTEGNGNVYCATRGGLFYLNKADNSLSRMSKINGLSDIEATLVRFNKFNNKLLIIYKNSNMDVLDKDAIQNFPDIKNKSIPGNKSINNVCFEDQYAYLACGFGIVVLDMQRNEVKDTYYIGIDGSAINVRDITTDANYIYAASDKGVFKALKNSNLTNFNSWSVMTDLPDGVYNTITNFNGKIYTNFSKYLTKASVNEDTIFVYNNSVWSHFPQGFGYIIKSLRGIGDKLIEVEDQRVWLYDNNLSAVSIVGDHSGKPIFPVEAIIDNSNYFWIADRDNGLIQQKDGVIDVANHPNGPSNTNIQSMAIEDGNLWIAPGGLSNSFSNIYNIDGLSSYSDGEWKLIKGNYSSVVNTDTVYDIVGVAIDPTNAKRVYAASWYNGLLEVYNKVPVKLYNTTNSSLQGLGIPGYNVIRIMGLAFDKSNNLWIANSGTPYTLSVKKSDGTWRAYKLDLNMDISQLIVTRADQKWMLFPRGGGVCVYKGGVNTVPDKSNTKVLTTEEGSGHLPSSNVTCIAEDLDGEIWMGSNKGIAVIYSPENVFTGQNYDAQQIRIQQDGQTQLLLESELVQSIAVDAANRKWIATANSGVFLVSADGTKEIQHFDMSNSPLFSNDVKSIAINHKTGEVFFGTAKGLISYKGNAVKGEEDYSNVIAFPNPVKHDYTGIIAIKGLVENTILKITDITGNLVYETVSLGGQAIWPGTNFKGDRVNTGVYVVFSVNQDGSKKVATKILFIN